MITCPTSLLIMLVVLADTTTDGTTVTALVRIGATTMDPAAFGLIILVTTANKTLFVLHIHALQNASATRVENLALALADVIHVQVAGDKLKPKPFSEYGKGFFRWIKLTRVDLWRKLEDP